MTDLTDREHRLLEALAATAGISVNEMTALLVRKYPHLKLDDAIREEASRV